MKYASVFSILLIVFSLLQLPSASASLKMKKFKTFVKAGDKYYADGKFKDSLNAYNKAFKIRHHPFLYFNIAQCHRMLGDSLLALKYYKKFLKVLPNPPNKAIVLKIMKNLESNVEGALIIKSSPSGAEVFIKKDGNLRKLGNTPVFKKLELDTYTIVIKKTGYKTIEKEITLYRKITGEINVSLVKVVEVKPEVKKPEVKKPEVKKPEVKPEVKNPEVKNPEVKTPAQAPIKPVHSEKIVKSYNPWTSWWFITGAVVSAGMFAVATINGLQTKTYYERYMETGIEQDKKDGLSYQRETDMYLGAGILTLGTVTVIALLTGGKKSSVKSDSSPDSDSGNKTMLLPFCTTKFCGLSLTHSF